MRSVFVDLKEKYTFLYNLRSSNQEFHVPIPLQCPTNETKLVLLFLRTRSITALTENASRSNPSPPLH